MSRILFVGVAMAAWASISCGAGEESQPLFGALQTGKVAELEYLGCSCEGDFCSENYWYPEVLGVVVHSCVGRPTQDDRDAADMACDAWCKRRNHDGGSAPNLYCDPGPPPHLATGCMCFRHNVC